MMLDGMPSCSGRRGINRKDATRQTLAVQTFYCSLQVPCILEFNKAEPSRVTRHAIAYHLRERDRMALILEPLP
jgi:hypothetical protein